MKELLATARNISFHVIEGRAVPSIEVIITVSEPHWEMDPGGETISRRKVECLRFSTSIEGLQVIATACENWIEQAEELVKTIRIEEPTDA